MQKCFCVLKTSFICIVIGVFVSEEETKDAIHCDVRPLIGVRIWIKAQLQYAAMYFKNHHSKT